MLVYITYFIKWGQKSLVIISNLCAVRITS